MTTTIYKAAKTRSGRPGWSVTFSHPRRRDARGKYGLKLRRGLGTRDDTEADRLVDQFNTLLSDPSWWSLDRRAEAEGQFDGVVVDVFFTDMETGKIKSKDLRDDIIRLPTPDEGYARVMLVGSTGAGKTTLLRQLIGTDPQRDRFPSTSTARTTTSDIEIVYTPQGPFEAVISFLTEHEVRCAVDECLEEACISVVRGRDDSGIINSLLEHREQRFRLKYPLGDWQQESPEDESNDYQFNIGMDFDTPSLADDEIVDSSEVKKNNERLRRYRDRIKEVATATSDEIESEHGGFKEKENANQRQAWLEAFSDALYENGEFAKLSHDIMDTIKDCFKLVLAGAFERSPVEWPEYWYYEEQDRDVFLKEVRWFSSNHSKQFGRLLTPLVDGIRVRGPFSPTVPSLQDDDRRLVLLDGEGLGHSAKEANSISTKVTEKFADAEMILLVDNAQSPMQAAPLELIRSVGNSGHARKLAIAFTHFDQVKGDNLTSYSQKREHVRASIGNAIASLRNSLGAPVTEMLERQLQDNDFYLGGLHIPTYNIPDGFIRDMRKLLDRMQEAAEPPESIDLAPNYEIVRLELALRDAADGFKAPWDGRLGLKYYQGTTKEHWTRVKALCRRLANRWDVEYSDLRPVADLIRQLQNGVSLWLENPYGWNRTPENEEEAQAAINEIRQAIFIRIHILSERRLIASHLNEWGTAYGFSGIGSSYSRAEVMGRIFDEAAPSVSSVMDMRSQEFRDAIIHIVREAIEEAGGHVRGT